MKILKYTLSLAVFWIVGSWPGFSQLVPNRYALILEDPPVSSRFASRETMQSVAGRSYQQQVEGRQKAMRAELATRSIPVISAVTTVMNTVFVTAPKERVAELQSLPGVKAVVQVRRYHQSLNRATGLVNAPAAWTALNGVQNAGSGVKIAILDSGIDQTHPAFQDSSLPMPPGFPLCSTGDCAFTNNKVIVARSYVRQLASGSAPTPAADSRPDDYSARDRDGHGTAVASCAAGAVNSGTLTFNGMAPKAYLGNYKIYGSPEVNDSTTDDVIITALEDAVHDGMDIVSFSSGGPAFTGPLDTGAACGNSPGVPCDLSAQAFENAVKGGMVIVAAAGNDGDSGNFYPAFTSISSPADAPSVIAAGATTNSHGFQEIVTVPGEGVSSNLQSITARFGDGYIPTGATTAALRDVAQLGNDGLACSALPSQSLIGAIALILRGGTCSFAVKALNALDGGALGVIFYMADQSPAIAPGGLSSFFFPAVMISNSDGVALKNFVAANPEHAVTIDPNGIEVSVPGANQLVSFSSFGPSTGDSFIKPDVIAPGTSIYMAAQTYDPLGALYSSNGYAVADGTSFTTPITSGAAALVKQKHPGFRADQIKSALVNTASQDVTADSNGNQVDVQSVGGGKVDALAAINAVVTSNPATISFGILTSTSLPKSQTLTFTNTGSSAVTLSIAVVSGIRSSGATLALDKSSLTLAPSGTAGTVGTVTATLAGALSSAVLTNGGEFSGAITMQGTGVSLRVPYLYLVGNGRAANILPMTGVGFDGTVAQGIPDGIISFKLTDANGVPVTGAPVSWSTRSGATITNADSVTDGYGIAAAQPSLGAQPGNYSFTAVAGGLSSTFSGTARRMPAITRIVDAASLDAATPVAPGSYIALMGTGLSDVTDYGETSILPLAIDYATVSFDIPSANLSLPGHLTYVSPTQINVQVPWELQGHSPAQVKVTIDFSNGNVVSLPLSDYAPNFFETASGVAAARDASFNVINSSNPARRGQVISLYANGLGPVSNQPASGDPAPVSPLAVTSARPTVTIGGQQADVAFSGLTPGLAGLYQINITVPSGLTPGNYPITVSINGQTSKASGISVQ